MGNLAEDSGSLPRLADPMLPHQFTIERVRMETDDTFTMELMASDGVSVCRFRPGQFNMLYAYGVGEAPISISGDPAKPEVLLHTTRQVGMVTRGLRDLRPGNEIGIRGPFGNSWPVESADGKDVVLVAGGIGLAPLRPVIYHVVRNRGRYGKFLLLYGARTPDDILYAKELQQWRSHFDLEVNITVDRATANWHGNVGVVTTLIPRSPFDPIDTVAFVCGPEIMMRFVSQELVKRGVPKSSIHVSMERNMKCGVGFCGHCQMRSEFVCKDGPIYSYTAIEEFFALREI